ncbi:hypothetical protein GCM10027456_51780 [Kineosporia babensis]
MKTFRREAHLEQRGEGLAVDLDELGVHPGDVDLANPGIGRHGIANPVDDRDERWPVRSLGEDTLGMTTDPVAGVRKPATDVIKDVLEHVDLLSDLQQPPEVAAGFDHNPDRKLNDAGAPTPDSLPLHAKPGRKPGTPAACPGLDRVEVVGVLGRRRRAQADDQWFPRFAESQFAEVSTS